MKDVCKKKILKCSICGLVVEVVGECNCPSIPSCCGQKMEEVTARHEDTGREKHVPAGEIAPDGHLLVKVGAGAEHPMTPEHHIVWVEWCYEGRSSRIYLDPSDQPRGHFCVKPVKGMKLREFCNVHGLWEGEY